MRASAEGAIGSKPESRHRGTKRRRRKPICRLLSAERRGQEKALDMGMAFRVQRYCSTAPSALDDYLYGSILGLRPAVAGLQPRLKSHRPFGPLRRPSA